MQIFSKQKESMNYDSICFWEAGENSKVLFSMLILVVKYTVGSVMLYT